MSIVREMSHKHSSIPSVAGGEEVACLVQVEDAKHAVAGQGQHQPVRQRGLIPGIAQVRVRPEHILPLLTSPLPAKISRKMY